MKQHKFVICDYTRCIACCTCMAACFESAYERGKLAKSRLMVLRMQKGVMPNQCRQCDDGPCANVCPTGALRFDDSCIDLHEEICIGCKLCTLACPYGAIQPSAELMPSVDYATEARFELGMESGTGAKSVAIKCDMCKGRESAAACVEVCPTGALVLVDPQEQNHKIGPSATVDVKPFINKILGINDSKKDKKGDK